MIRLLLADDEDLIREALATLLGLEPDLEVIAQAGDGASAVALTAQHAPDLVMLDLEMPVFDGVEAARRILLQRQVPIVLLTRHARPGVLRRALAGGVRAFVTRRPRPTGSRGSCATTLGGRYVDPEIAATALTEDACPLTERELELLRLVREGLSAGAIAAAAHLAPAPSATTPPARWRSSAPRPAPTRRGSPGRRAGSSGRRAARPRRGRRRPRAFCRAAASPRRRGSPGLALSSEAETLSSEPRTVSSSTTTRSITSYCRCSCRSIVRITCS